MKRYPQEVKDKALELWGQGCQLEEISKKLGIPFTTITTWHQRGNWSEKRKEQKKKNELKLSEKIAQEDAKYRINIRNAFLDNFYDLKDKKQKAKKVFEYTVLTKQQDIELFNVARIDGLITEKKELKGNLRHEIVPIFGSEIKANVPSHDSNKKNNTTD